MVKSIRSIVALFLTVVCAPSYSQIRGEAYPDWFTQRYVGKIEPMITTHWSHCSPYNDSIPRKLGICVPLSYAQMLHYYRVKGTSTDIYDEYYGVSLSPTSFNHNLILDKYNQESSDESKAEVAKLVKYCFYPTMLDLLPGEAFGIKIRYYTKNPISLYFPGTYDDVVNNTSEFLDSCLESGNPVIGEACNTETGVGHNVIIDGRDSEGRYHINWGWGGDSDGYYAIANDFGDKRTSWSLYTISSFMTFSYDGFTPVQKGDLNGDGTVDSSDIEEIKEYLMGNPSDYFNEDNADVNEDGYVNIADIVAIINIIKNKSDNDKSDNYLTFVAEDACTFNFIGTSGNTWIYYSLDSGTTWYEFPATPDTPAVEVSAGQKIMWKGTLTPVTGGIGRFSSTGRFQVEGNAMSLLYGDNFIGQTSLSGKDYALNMLFRDCTGLTSAENLSLPATILSYRCYRGMFAGCTGLTTAPSILPALILASNCYENMFYSCTSLTTVPQLPAPTLVHACYNLMFQGCTSLNYIKCLATDISATNCTYNWLYGVSSTGTFVKAQGTAWTTGDSGIPSGWTVQESGNYLTFVAQETGTFKFCGTEGNDNISYSLDSGNTWYTLARDTDSPTVSSGQKIMWKGLLTPGTTDGNFGIGSFSSSGRFEAEGNIMSLLFGDSFSNKTSLSGNKYAFRNLLRNCTGLTSAENLILPATTLANGCYYEMFYGCTSLTTAPEIPATDTFNGGMSCYYGMFSGCASLTKAPTSLPCNSYRNWSCAYMFSGCTSLTTAPELNYNAETYEGCFAGMFDGCTSLTTAPASLPNNMAEMACMSMFRGCTSLTTAPVLPATYIMRYAYSQMFQGCTSLNYIKCLATGMDSSRDATTNWVDGVASSGTFVKASNMSSWSRGVSGIPSGWTVQNDTPSGNDNNNNVNGDVADGYLTFVAQETGTFKFGGIRGNEGISYSLDEGSTWYSLARNTDSPTVSAGNKIMWKGLLTPLSSYEDGIGTFSSTGRFTVEGNIMSLLYGDDFQNKTSLSGKDFAFAGLFSSCTGLTSAENLVLPATTLASDCYYYMFRGCTSLTAAPSVLPATKLSFSCYEAMFSGCTSLTTAPELPATTLAYSCYSNMFNGCTSLNNIKCLATDISATNCTYNWVNGVSSSGTFVKAQGTVWTTGVSGIPSGWTMQNDTPSGTADGDKITDDEGNNSSSNIVGVWEVTSIETNVSVRNAIGEKIHFNADGTYSDPLDSGRWSLSGNKLTIIFSTPDMVPVEFLVLALTDSELSLKAVLDEFSGKQFSHLSVRIIIHFKRVG